MAKNENNGSTKKHKSLYKKKQKKQIDTFVAFHLFSRMNPAKFKVSLQIKPYMWTFNELQGKTNLISIRNRTLKDQNIDKQIDLEPEIAITS